MRRALLTIKYDNNDISADISDSLLSFTYNDNKAGEADDIEITLENRANLWQGDWYPSTGAKLTVGLNVFNFGSEGENININFGVFAIDELTFNKATFTIKAIAAVCESAFNCDVKFKQWENITLKEVAEEIAGANGMQLVWKLDSNRAYERIYQIEETDAAFLTRCFKQIGVKIKISEERIIVYENKVGSSDIVITPDSDILTGFSFKSKSYDVYSACEISYLDPTTNELKTYRAEDNNIKNKRVLTLSEEVESLDMAQVRAGAALAEANQNEVSGSLDFMGDARIWSALDIKLEDFGAFSGSYIIESASHKLDRSGGYKTSCSVIKSSNEEEEI